MSAKSVAPANRNNPLAEALASTFALSAKHRRELAHCLRIAVSCDLALEPASVRQSTDQDVRKLFGLEVRP